ncbi:chloride channel protein [Lamprobacter modestohalophilus]|uniref:Chloride channel protein n=1 Tax=Lamprobacter modestohalophilus TaxID=1064514 RepID=A0A9X0W9G0_9GAMM|nr:chloride channel protein [Lamprobacter modestohalophilus]MBK1619435.1 chloride channel protein [Lamprobacter modestohalophilus]
MGKRSFMRGRRPSLERLRLQLARPDALFSHALLGLVTGLATGIVIVVFRLAVEGTQAVMLPDHGENYEAIAPLWRFLLPVLGAVLIGLLFLRFAKGIYVLGVARVLERMEYHQGHMTLRGFVLQFLGAAIAIISGHSVGREGPHVYLGAAGGSLIGQWLSLPNNSIRTMVACGTAAGISASFNTPLAGVIFALEVLALEYSITGFIPIILAAVSANALSVWLFGSAPTFAIPPFLLTSLSDLLPVLLLGLFAGAVSAAYIQLLQSIASASKPLSFFTRVCLAGLAAGTFGVLVPEVMGLGYDSLGDLLTQTLPWTFLLVLLIAKLLATSTSVGLGIPGGTIGPALFMGATVGHLTGVMADSLTGTDASHASFYALLGMGAMMGASLQAPLAALTAVVELTHSPGVIMPGMLTIILAAVTSKQLFRKDSLFVTMLRANGLDYRSNPVVAMLRRSGVTSAMNTRLSRQEPLLSREQAQRLMSENLDWIIVDRDGKPAFAMPGIAIASHLSQDEQAEEIDLLEIPADRLELAPVHLQATLQEALDILNREGAEALYVTRPIAPGINHIYGVLTRGRIESAYRY